MFNSKVLFTMFLVCALSASSHASVFHEQTMEKAGGGADGRGTGNGITGPVYDIFFTMAKELSSLSDTNTPSNVSGFPGAEDNVPSLYSEKIGLDVDAISGLMDRRIVVEGVGSIFTNENTSYAYYEEVLYLNADYWDQRLLKGNAEIDVIAIILRVTGHNDRDNAIAKKLADLIKRKAAANNGNLDIDSRDGFDAQGFNSSDVFNNPVGVDSRDAFDIQF